MSRTTIIVLLVFGATGVGVYSFLQKNLAVDGCLDSGGSYDYVAAECDLEQSRPFRPPDFIVELSEQFASESPDTAPLQIQSFLYHDASVYYVAPKYCCDLPGILYSETGEVICRAGGGFAGNYNDGNCPDFFDARSDERLLWEHPQRQRD